MIVTASQAGLGTAIDGVTAVDIDDASNAQSARPRMRLIWSEHGSTSPSGPECRPEEITALIAEVTALAHPMGRPMADPKQNMLVAGG